MRPVILFAGETRLDIAVAAKLLQQQQAGFVPLTVWARVPIRIKFGAIKLWKMTGKATCNLVVDNLVAGRRPDRPDCPERNSENKLTQRKFAGRN